MKSLLSKISKCTKCNVPLEHRPILQADKVSEIMIVGQAPGIKAHESGTPWNDASGKRLRKWLGVSEDEFYNSEYFSLIPMSFCYPGKGKSGDLPPLKDCAPAWHGKLMDSMPNQQLIILAGKYAQDYYLKDKKKLTERVGEYKSYLPRYFPIVHPSPNSRFWLKKNPWFEEEVVPELQEVIRRTLYGRK